MFDVAKHLGAVTRAVEDSTHGDTPVKVVVASRTYATDVDDLWTAITDPERIPRWFAPVSGDLRLGGRFQVEGNAGGEVLACEAPEHLATSSPIPHEEVEAWGASADGQAFMTGSATRWGEADAATSDDPDASRAAAARTAAFYTGAEPPA